MSRKDKIQYLLISHLLEEGQIKINLPNGMMLELGILKEDKHGRLEKKDNYCWLIASHKDREVSIDSFKLGLRFYDDDDRFVFEESSITEEGQPVKVFSLV